MDFGDEIDGKRVGVRVTFNDKGGRDQDRTEAKRQGFRTDQEYTIVWIKVYAWYTDIALAGMTGRHNASMFDVVAG